MKFSKSTAERIILSLSKPSYSLKLTRELNISVSNISRVLATLRKEKLIRDIESPNRRTKLIEITEKGIEIRKCLLRLKELE